MSGSPVKKVVVRNNHVYVWGLSTLVTCNWARWAHEQTEPFRVLLWGLAIESKRMAGVLWKGVGNSVAVG